MKERDVIGGDVTNQETINTRASEAGSVCSSLLSLHHERGYTRSIRGLSGSGARGIGSRARRSLPFFLPFFLSWNSPFSACLLIPASYNYGNVAGLDERGYRAMPRVEQTCQLSVPRLGIVSEGSGPAFQAAASHLSVGRQGAYQADLLKELDEGEEIKDNDIAEIRRTADLALRATKACPGGRGETSLVDPVRYERKGQGLPFGRPAFAFCSRGCWAGAAPAVYQLLIQGGAKAERSKSGPDLRVVLQAEKSSTKRQFRTAEGSPIWGEAGCTASFGVRRPPVPSGGRLANPASASGRSDLQQASASVSSARKRSGAGELATPEGVSGAASSGASCRETVTGHCSSGSSNTRGQSRETGSLSRSFGSVETTAQCVCLGPAYCRNRLLYTIWRTSTAVQRGPEQGLVMEQEVATLLRKEAIEVVPPHDRESGFYSQYFIVPKKDGGLCPILDLRVLNRSVMKLKFKMLTVKQVVSQIRSEDWFVTIDLKDAYFHVSILPQHRKFLRFAFRGEAYQYRVLPFGLALSPRTITKCVDAALAPLRLRGICILNYIDDWLILAQSEQLAAQHRDVVLAHVKELGLRLNAKKSMLSPSQRTTYLGVVWDSTTMQARLSPARIESILAAVKRVKEGRSLTVK
ncbi:Transposon Ty3-G Gag-Pol polyprotein [Labeo rohita]|uniref:ribonuclease H n=1 Tax=Labeo rohita TaxID=84645 RepID=A0ABQ8L3C8_LABRO|nr:Transposon Ty3-G Gag-Pol polyprotein [Labeo rohita]